MAFIDWSSKMSVGIEEIDIQHKKLIQIINEIHEMLKTNSFEEKLDSVFNKLIMYTIYHFRTEEAYMEMVNYTNLESHKKQHEKFVNKLKRLKSRCYQGREGIVVELSSFLSGWMISHILHSDKDYTEAMKKSEQHEELKKSA